MLPRIRKAAVLAHKIVGRGSALIAHRANTAQAQRHHAPDRGGDRLRPADPWLGIHAYRPGFRMGAAVC